MTINHYKIGTVLKDLNEQERIYLDRVLNISNHIRKLIEDYNLSKDEVCEHFNINAKKYDNYITGHHNYSIKDIAILNALHVKLASEKVAEDAAENVPVKFNTD